MSKNSEIEKDTGKGTSEDITSYVPGKPYSKLGRELADDDLSNPAVQKLLISEIDKLEIRVAGLELIECRFHETDKDKAVLEEKLRTHNSMEVLYSFCLAIGSGLLGFASMFKIEKEGWIFIVSGSILIIGGILSKLVKKWN